MPAAPVVQANYQTLDQIAARFGDQTERCATLDRRLRQALQPLQDGGWIGRGAQDFSGEMDGVLLPALQRLTAALAAGREVTLTISAQLHAAEQEAAAIFAQSGSTSPNPTANAANKPTLLDALLKGLPGLAWQLFKERNDIRAFLNGVRFVQDANGMWRLFGSRAAKEALGLSGNLTRFGQAAIKKNLAHFSVFGNLKEVAVGKGPFADRAAKLMQSLTTTAPLKRAADFMTKFKGAAIIGGALDIAKNVYEFGWGDSKATGLLSRQFVTATTADVSAGVGIVAASTAIGTLIPIPGVGTAVGFVAGVGLQYAYDTWGKDAWRGAVDRAGQFVQEHAARLPGQVSQLSRDVSSLATTFETLLKRHWLFRSAYKTNVVPAEPREKPINPPRDLRRF